MPTKIKVRSTAMPGLLAVDLVVHGDNRGWFKENWHKAQMEAAGLPAFEPVQNNISYNRQRGVTRGIHAEPWDKFISLGHGEIFAAIVDFRKGAGFGKVITFKLMPNQAIYVPRGCANSFQTLTADVVYTYLVNDYWSPKTVYTMLNLADPTVAIKWPIPLSRAIVSDKDKQHPFLDKVKPVEL